MQKNINCNTFITILLLFIIPLSAAFGSYMFPFTIAHRTFYMFQILVIFGFIYVCYQFFRNKNQYMKIINLRSVKYFIFMAFVWIIYGSLTILWAKSQSAAIKEIMVVVFGFMTCGTLFLLIKTDEKKMNNLFLGWMITFAVCSVIAIWEKITGNHLPGFYKYIQKWQRYRFVVSTFGNPNNLGAFLVLSYPILLGAYLTAKKYFKYLALILLFILPFILVNTAARISIIAIIIEVLLVLIFEIKNKKRFMVILKVNIIMVIIFYLALIPSLFNFNNAVQNNTAEKMDRTMNEINISGTSVNVRINMIKNGIDFLVQSHGKGIGAGNFEYMISHGYGKYETGNDVNPHNFWIEILSQYGILVFGLFVFWFIMIFIKAIKTLIYEQKLKNNDMIIKLHLFIAGLICYILAAIENSRYITQPINWVYIAVLLCFSSFMYKKGNNTSIK